MELWRRLLCFLHTFLGCAGLSVPTGGVRISAGGQSEGQQALSHQVSFVPRYISDEDGSPESLGNANRCLVLTWTKAPSSIESLLTNIH